MRRKWFVVAFAAIALCTQVTRSHAALVSYLDSASFQAAAGLTSLETFDSITPELLATPGAPNFSKNIGSFTISGNGVGDYVAIASGSAYATINGTNSLYVSQANPTTGAYNGNGSAGPNFTISFATAQTAFGFDYKDSDPTDSYAITINGTTYTNPPFSASSTGSGFFGVVATGGETFTSVIFTQQESGGVVDPFVVDNIRYKGASLAAVPEPSTIALACSAVPMGLILAIRRRRNAA